MYRLLLLLFPFSLFGQQFSPAETNRWEKQAQRVTITRDQWGVPHIEGRSDADAVFGLLYAQCEDDFKRVELNYIEKLGRLAEVQGKSLLYDDLLIRMLIDTSEAKADYQKAPKWLKKLLQAYADGINFYLFKHPETQPALLRRFEPWFPLLWTDGSIGAIQTDAFTAADLQRMYEGDTRTGWTPPTPARHPEPNPTGSNGFAFAPSISRSGNAILYINPHVTFYFRPEVHVSSREGLNTYGAVTWGQFFVYQGFNEHCGWMHTSSFADVADTYIEKVRRNQGRWEYLYEGKWQAFREKQIQLSYLENGQLQSRSFQVYYSGHGPVMARPGAQEWLTLKSQNRSMTSLIQSWQRTKATNLKSYQKVMALRANASNNTVYADAKGNIAYWHGNFHPKRDPRYDWSKPVDGTVAATEWKGLHPPSECFFVANPNNGWLQNCNATPFTVAGAHSPSRDRYPAYMAPDGENFRGLNAVRVLQETPSWDLDRVIAAGYDTRLTAFEILVPALVEAYDSGPSAYQPMRGAVEYLRHWDYRCDTASVAATLAVEWGYLLLPEIQKVNIQGDLVDKTRHFAKTAGPEPLLRALAQTLNDLSAKFGTWEIPWGELNRFQRVSGDIQQAYSDQQPSWAVPFTSSLWGCLPSYTARYFPPAKKRYGVHGNSFVCAVEFGPKIKAKSLLAGGQSGDPGSKHFFDQGAMYAQGRFKTVLFYKEEIARHAERVYHPGE